MAEAVGLLKVCRSVNTHMIAYVVSETRRHDKKFSGRALVDRGANGFVTGEDTKII